MDPELGLAAAIKHEKGCQANVSPKAGRRCVIAVQHLDGRAIPINVIIEEVNGGLVLNSTQKQIFQAVTRSWLHRLVGNLIMGLVVGTARVKQVKYCGPRPCCTGHRGPQFRIYLGDFTLDPLLTEALFNPHLLLSSVDYPLDIDNFGSLPGLNNEELDHLPEDICSNADDKTSRTCIEPDDQEVLVVRRVIDRAKVAWLLILLLFFSPTLGIGVGFFSHNADVGIAVSAGIFALASFVQGLVAWIQG
ncbi:hypothetical protein BDR22DRAFT_893249 [Usnea florida]